MGDDLGNADAVFAYDASLMTPRGVILMSLGKEKRWGEEGLHKSFYSSKGITIIGQVEAPGTAEAGDTLWLFIPLKMKKDGAASEKLKQHRIIIPTVIFA